MSYWFGDSFDLYSAVTDAATYWDASLGPSPTLAVSQITRFGVGRSLSPVSTNTGPYLAKTSGQNDAVHHISIAAMQQATFSGSSNYFFISFYDGATIQCTVSLRSDGSIALMAGAVSGTVLATYSGALAAINTWYQFEIEVVISNTAGSIAVRKLGNTVNDFFLGSLNTRASANNYANKIGIGSNFGPVNSWYGDDFLWRSDATSLAWLGDIRCYTRMPNSDASVQFTRSGAIVPQTPLQPVSGSLNSMSANAARYEPFTAFCSGTIGSITLPIVAASTANLKAAIYTNSVSNMPGTPLGTSNPVAAPGVGTATFTFPTPPAVTQGTPYWVAFCSDTTSGSHSVSSVGGSGWQGTTTYASFPATNPAPGTSISAPYFTLQITPSPIYNAQFVGEAQQDGALTYVYSNTVGQSDLYNLASLSATPGSIIGVTTRAYMEKSDAGTRIAAVQLQSGAANVQASLVLNTVWGWAWRSDLVDPSTSAAWTATGVNSAQIGPVVTA